jgi:putative ATPase
MKHVGYGKEYRYVHSDPDAKQEMECLPERLKGRKYFKSDEETAIADRVKGGEQ